MTLHDMRKQHMA